MFVKLQSVLTTQYCNLQICCAITQPLDFGWIAIHQIIEIHSKILFQLKDYIQYRKPRV